MAKGERLTVEEAAKEIGCDKEFLRRQMRRKDSGRWDLGEVVNPMTSGEKRQYLIFRPKLDKFLGKEAVESD